MWRDNPKAAIRNSQSNDRTRNLESTLNEHQAHIVTEEPKIEVLRSGALQKFTLNRPHVLNAFDDEMCAIISSEDSARCPQCRRLHRGAPVQQPESVLRRRRCAETDERSQTRHRERQNLFAQRIFAQLASRMLFKTGRVVHQRCLHGVRRRADRIQHASHRRRKLQMGDAGDEDRSFSGCRNCQSSGAAAVAR